MKRILALLLFFAVLLSITVGCSNTESLPIRMDINGGVKNLDPQFATDSVSRTIILNSFEGLLCKDKSGRIVPGVAERYEVSTDGLHYIFFLRRDAKWNDGEAVSADDFIFALRRLFHPQVPSPYAEEFLAIKNAPMVLSGALPQSALGVRAKDDYTLEITLSEASPLFLEKLTSTAAMPCNEEFFTETRARYGLESAYLKFNGAYWVSHWDNAKYIELKPNPNYHTQNELPFPEVYLYTSRSTASKTALDLFNEGKSDIYLATAEELPRLTVKDVSYLEIKNRVWQLVFNTEYKALDNENIRRGLALSLDSSGYTDRIPEMYGLAKSLIPQSARPVDMGTPHLLGFDREGAKTAIETGLDELERSEMPPLNIIIPDSAQLNVVTGYLQKQWKDSLGIYVNMEAIPRDLFEKRMQSGDFSLALSPLEASGQDCADVLSTYAGMSMRNYGRFKSDEFDMLLGDAVKAGNEQQSLEYYRTAEQLLIDRVAAVPLFTQSGYYAFSKGTTGVSLVGGQLNFRMAFRGGR